MSSQLQHWERLSMYPPDASVIDPRDSLGFKNEYIANLRNRAVIELLPSVTDIPVLDFGCGTGGLSMALAMSGYRVIGLDISPGLLRRTGERGLDEQALFVRFDGCRVPIANEAVCNVTTYVVLNHIIEDDHLIKVLREIRRVLVPEGRLIAIEQVRRRASIDLGVWQHRRTIEGFTRLFRSAGLEPVSHRIIRYGRLPSTYALRLGLVPRSLHRRLQILERALGSVVGVLPWDYCDVRFEVRKA